MRLRLLRHGLLAWPYLGGVWIICQRRLRAPRLTRRNTRQSVFLPSGSGLSRCYLRLYRAHTRAVIQIFSKIRLRSDDHWLREHVAGREERTRLICHNTISFLLILGFLGDISTFLGSPETCQHPNGECIANQGINERQNHNRGHGPFRCAPSGFVTLSYLCGNGSFFGIL